MNWDSIQGESCLLMPSVPKIHHNPAAEDDWRIILVAIFSTHIPTLENNSNRNKSALKGKKHLKKWNKMSQVIPFNIKDLFKKELKFHGSKQPLTQSASVSEKKKEREQEKRKSNNPREQNSSVPGRF